MAKFPTYPTLYDSVNQISITKLKEWNYLKPHQISKGIITWSINGKETASISFLINTFVEQHFIILDYKYRDKPIKYKVFLKVQYSNLGKGYFYYFICPVTGKQARKLYLSGGYFLHRTAFNGCMYECQIKSKYMRKLDKLFGAHFDYDKLYDELYRKYFKKFYAGKPTKRYKRIINQLKKTSQINYSDFNTLLINSKSKIL
ncbi:MAG: hypothetical protein GXO80_10225 [Chlorobi bacterium]|nr:hypothetical protein [Chlorobiota bacterium]